MVACMDIHVLKEEYLEEYYADNGRKLRGEVDRILSRFGGIVQADYDDFYSLANEVFTDVWEGYDGKRSFGGFFYTCLSNRIKAEITKRNRIKRQGERESVSLDATLDDGKCTVGEFLASDFDMEKELSYPSGAFYDGKMEQYFQSLSKLQRRIIEMRMDRVSKKDIMKKLGISEKVYEDNFHHLKSYDKVSVLLGKTGQTTEDRKKYGIENEIKDSMREELNVAGQTVEKSKETRYSVFSYLKKLENYSIRKDHPLQRKSDQWGKLQKDNLITTVLNEDPIPPVVLAEQIRPYGRDNWLIDGLQRLSSLDEYRNNSFRIGKNAERPIISYQSIDRDAEGNVTIIEGAPVYVNREFDMRGKYYRDLPNELKERFNDFTIPAVQYLNCSDDDIEYHIRRYNAAKPMSAAQKGITHLGEQYARVVKSLSGHAFFKDKGSFKMAEFTNGAMDRVITESIMAIYFLNDWKKKNEDACTYLKENGRVSQFDNFEEMLNRLTDVVTKEAAQMFNSRDSFLWFALFDRFSESGLEDEKFVDFMEKFNDSLHFVKVNGMSYDDLCVRNTKDKKTVVEKLDIMESQMDDYLHIQKEEKADGFVLEIAESYENGYAGNEG